MGRTTGTMWPWHKRKIWNIKYVFAILVLPCPFSPLSFSFSLLTSLPLSLAPYLISSLFSPSPYFIPPSFPFSPLHSPFLLLRTSFPPAFPLLPISFLPVSLAPYFIPPFCFFLLHSRLLFLSPYFIPLSASPYFSPCFFSPFPSFPASFSLLANSFPTSFPPCLLHSFPL